MSNEGCLEGMACPKCGSEGPFRIEATSVFFVYDDGAESYEDVEWADESFCGCEECSHEGTVGTFTIAKEVEK